MKAMPAYNAFESVRAPCRAPGEWLHERRLGMGGPARFGYHIGPMAGTLVAAIMAAAGDLPADARLATGSRGLRERHSRVRRAMGTYPQPGQPMSTGSPCPQHDTKSVKSASSSSH